MGQRVSNYWRNIHTWQGLESDMSSLSHSNYSLIVTHLHMYSYISKLVESIVNLSSFSFPKTCLLVLHWFSLFLEQFVLYLSLRVFLVTFWKKMHRGREQVVPQISVYVWIQIFNSNGNGISILISLKFSFQYLVIVHVH